MSSPPKPWEQARARPAATHLPPHMPQNSLPPRPAPGPAAPPTSTGAPPTLRPALSAPAPPAAVGLVPRLPAPTGPMTANSNALSAYNPSGMLYNSLGGPYSAPFSAPYPRYGGPFGGTYGGGMYGGYGGGMFQPGMYGPNANNANSLTNQLSMNTQATFRILEGIVGAFGGFTQMLESTYMATQSSFYAMLAVAEQFGNLRDALGSVLGIFTIMRWLRTLLAKITGRPPPADAVSLTPAAFMRFLNRNDPSTRPSRKPLLFFFLAAFGLPYVVNRLIRSLATSAEEEERRRHAQLVHVDPSRLEYYRVLHDFIPPAHARQNLRGLTLDVHRGDLVAILTKTDPAGNLTNWWQCRSRDGAVGYLPSTYLQLTAPLSPPPAQSAAIEAPRSIIAPESPSTSTVATEPIMSNALSLHTVPVAISDTRVSSDEKPKPDSPKTNSDF